MIFKNYRELINYVISHYPYEKIITYSRDLDYKWVITNNKNEIVDIRIPTKWDIVKCLVYELSSLCYIDLGNKVIEATDNNISISKIYMNYWRPSFYINIKFNKDRKLLYVRYKFRYSYSGRFNKYPLPRSSCSTYFNWKTDVVFRFSEDNKII